MAFVQRKHCDVCHQVTQWINGKCNECRHREERLRIAQWDALSTRDKLHDLRQRIEKLEAGPPRY